MTILSVLLARVVLSIKLNADFIRRKERKLKASDTNGTYSFVKTANVLYCRTALTEFRNGLRESCPLPFLQR